MLSATLVQQRLSVRCARGRSSLAAPALIKSTATSQHVSTEGLIFSKGGAGSWDETAVGSPVVRCYLGDDEERWVMWYSGRKSDAPVMDMIAPSSGSTGVAISSNGLQWMRGEERITGEKGVNAATDVGMILQPNEDWWWFDTCHMQVSDVQIFSNSTVQSGIGVFWMFYSGGDFNTAMPPAALPGLPALAADSVPAQQPIEGLCMRPGLAMSQDGRNWARIEADHHTGALFDVGEPGEWDELYIATPKVIAAGPKDMRLFYHSWDQRRARYIIGVATSPDGFKWAKQGVVFDPSEAAGGGGAGAFDELGAAAFSVTRDVDNRQYVMFYEAVAADNTRSIGMAVSTDGLTGWQRCPQPILRQGEGASWDSGSVGQPCAVSMSKGKWRLYYSGRRGAGGAGAYEGIGVALSVEGGSMFLGMPTEFKRREAVAA